MLNRISFRGRMGAFRPFEKGDDVSGEETMRGKRKQSTIDRQVASILIMGLASAFSNAVKADSLIVYGGPTYNNTTDSGYKDPGLTDSSAGSGIGIGNSESYVSGSDKGNRAVKWDSSGFSLELGNLGVDNNGFTTSQAVAINAGTIVGYATKYVSGINEGDRAVKWDLSGVPTELSNLGTNPNGVTRSEANALNDAGTIVGNAEKYNGSSDIGARAVRWNASGVATELGNLGTDSTGYTSSSAAAVNHSGTAVGSALKLSLTGNDLGTRAVRWDASGTPAAELGNLGTDNNGKAHDYAVAINNAGTAVGYAEKYASGINVGNRAVRWDASGISVTELNNLGTNLNSGQTNSAAIAINNSGVAVGYAEKYYVFGGGFAFGGDRAVRWDASGNVTELGNLGLTGGGGGAPGTTEAEALAINDTGIAVGYAARYDNGIGLGQRATMWGDDGVAIDLNDLIDPTGGWVLTEAVSISSDDWITGYGRFDPDGAGPQPATDRVFLIQVPEPAPVSMLMLSLLAMLVRKKKDCEIIDVRR